MVAHTHKHLCLRCGDVVGTGDDCDGDADHDYALCATCADSRDAESIVLSHLTPGERELYESLSQ